MAIVAMDERAERDSASSDEGFGRLRIGNLTIGLVHLAQAIAILALSTDFSLPVTGLYLQGPPGGPSPSMPFSEGDLPVGPLVSVFLLMAAIDHLLVSVPGIFGWYVRNLRRGVNYARWYEYTFSATLMIVLIAALSGISDIAALVGIAGTNGAMILFGLLMERFNPRADREAGDDRGGPTDWSPFLFGCFAGIMPWVAIVIYIAGAEENATDAEGVPTFVYAIQASLFLLFNSFAVNQWLQYRRVGPWRRYVFGEWVYIGLSAVAKSALAWQIFAATLM
ncbi:MAG: heliorhodopsin HeR [Chloroflexota bacterium]|nr:heliorhodopsin HeR [Chloroflexota bacterium]